MYTALYNVSFHHVIAIYPIIISIIIVRGYLCINISRCLNILCCGIACQIKRAGLSVCRKDSKKFVFVVYIACICINYSCNKTLKINWPFFWFNQRFIIRKNVGESPSICESIFAKIRGVPPQLNFSGRFSILIVSRF